MISEKSEKVSYRSGLKGLDILDTDFPWRHGCSIKSGCGFFIAILVSAWWMGDQSFREDAVFIVYTHTHTKVETEKNYNITSCKCHEYIYREYELVKLDFPMGQKM